MANRTCSVDGCDNPHSARGWCKKHHSRWLRHGSPHVVLKRRDRTPDEMTCVVPDCDRPAHCADLCGMHYCRQTRHGRLDHPHPRRRAPVGEHWCSRCQRYYPVEDFYSNKARPAGLADQCKTCQNAATRNWLDRHPDYRQSTALARRSGISSAEGEHFTRWEIAERDGWLCQICLQARRPKSAARISKSKAWPDPASLSLDHIVPINDALGHRGAHTRVNVQAAHLGCNWRKNNKGCDQLRLFG